MRYVTKCPISQERFGAYLRETGTQALIRSMSNGKAGWMFSFPTVGYFTAAVFHTMSLAFSAGESLKEDIIVAKITSVLMHSQYNIWVNRLSSTYSFSIERT